MRIVEYDYKPEFASAMGINTAHQTGTDPESLFNFKLPASPHLFIPSLCAAAFDNTCQSNTSSEKPTAIGREG